MDIFCVYHSNYLYSIIIICVTVIVCLWIIMSYWKKIVESKNKSSESQLELNLSHEKAMKEVGWNQKMQLEDRLALKEKEKIVYQYVDELWKKREVLSEKELEVLVLLTLVLDDKSFEERIDKVKKTILKK